MSQILARSISGGTSFFSLLLLAFGIAMLVMQAIWLATGQAAEASIGLRFVPAIAGVVLITMFFLQRRAKGEMSISTSGIQGTRSNGQPFDISFTEVERVDLIGHQLTLFGAEGGPLFRDRAPNDRHMRGLIWLLVHRPELPASIWEQYDHQASFECASASRLFLNEEGEPDFVDMGMVLAHGGQHYFLPETETAAYQLNRKDGGVSTVPVQDRLVFHFEPSPRILPWQQLLAAVSKAGEMDALLPFLAQEHGGSLLAAGEEAGEWTGECAGHQILVRSSTGL